MRESIDCPLEELESVETVRCHLLAIFGGSVDVPRMRQRSMEIGDLSVNPMWF